MALSCLLSYGESLSSADRNPQCQFIKRDERIEWGIYSMVQSKVQTGGASFSGEI